MSMLFPAIHGNCYDSSIFTPESQTILIPQSSTYSLNALGIVSSVFCFLSFIRLISKWSKPSLLENNGAWCCGGTITRPHLDFLSYLDLPSFSSCSSYHFKCKHIRMLTVWKFVCVCACARACGEGGHLHFHRRGTLSSATTGPSASGGGAKGGRGRGQLSLGSVEGPQGRFSPSHQAVLWNDTQNKTKRLSGNEERLKISVFGSWWNRKAVSFLRMLLKLLLAPWKQAGFGRWKAQL